MGITAGAHRLWAHRAYKAKLPLRVFLMLCQTLAFQVSVDGSDRKGKGRAREWASNKRYVRRPPFSLLICSPPRP